MPDALFFSPEPPFPLHGGGALRSASLLQYLASRYEVDLVLFREEGRPDPLAAIPRELFRDSLTLALPFHSRRGPDRALRNLQRLVRGAVPLNDRFSGHQTELARWLSEKRYDLAVVEHSWCAAYAPVLRPRAATLVLDLHNIESVLLARSARSEGGFAGLALRRFARLCEHDERHWLPRFDLLLATSVDDQREALRLSSGARTIVYPNALPLRDLPHAVKDDTIVFSGNFAYGPNAAGARWFRRRVWPLLRDRFPDLRWRLLGKGAEAIRTWTAGDSRIEASGPVDDAHAWLARSLAAVVPLESGSGTRVKILEAWAACLPVVSTPVGAEGLPVRDGENILLAASPEDFAAAIARILQDSALSARLAAAGRCLYERGFTWPAAWAALAEAGL